MQHKLYISLQTGRSRETRQRRGERDRKINTRRREGQTKEKKIETTRYGEGHKERQAQGGRGKEMVGEHTFRI
jgi:hypothetical protein